MPLQLRKLLRQYQSLLVACLLLIASFAGVILGIVPLAQKVFELAGEISDLQEEQRSLSAKAAFLQSWDEQSLRTMVAGMTSAVPPDKSITTLFSTMDGLQRETGAVVSDLAVTSPGSVSTVSATKKVSTDEKRLGLNILAFAATVNGSFDQVRNFIVEAVSGRRFLRVKTFTLSTPQGDAVKAHVEFDTFYQPFPAQIGSVISTLAPLGDEDNDLIKKVSAMPLYGVDLEVPQAAAVGTEFREDPFSP